MVSELEPRAVDPRICRASALVARQGAARPDGEPWPPPGAVVELCGGFDGAVTSLAIAAVAASQRRGGITAWLQRRHGPLFPPDCAAGGIDLDALVVIHVPLPPDKNSPARNGTRQNGAHDLPKAAELLLRSGAFDLAVLDLRQALPPRGAWPGRLQALAREHHSRVLLLTDAHATLPFTTGLSQRLGTRRRRVGRDRATKDGPDDRVDTASDMFVVEHELVRDKLHAPPPALLPHRGPPGLQ